MAKSHTVTFSYNPEKLVLFNGTSERQSQAERLVEQLGLEETGVLDSEGELKWLESSAELSDILRQWRQLYKALDRKKRMLKRDGQVVRTSTGTSTGTSTSTGNSTSTGTEDDDEGEEKVDYTSSGSTDNERNSMRSDSTQTSPASGGDATTGIAGSTPNSAKHTTVSSDEGDSLHRRKRLRV